MNTRHDPMGILQWAPQPRKFIFIRLQNLEDCQASPGSYLMAAGPMWHLTRWSEPSLLGPVGPYARLKGRKTR